MTPAEFFAFLEAATAGLWLGHAAGTASIHRLPCRWFRFAVVGPERLFWPRGLPRVFRNWIRGYNNEEASERALRRWRQPDE